MGGAATGAAGSAVLLCGDLPAADQARCAAESVQCRGGVVDGCPYAHVGGAAAQIAAHRLVDLRVGGVGVAAQQGDRRHDLAGLAEAALRHVQFAPGVLHGLPNPVGADAFDGDDAPAAHVQRQVQQAETLLQAQAERLGEQAGSVPRVIVGTGEAAAVIVESA